LVCVPLQTKKKNSNNKKVSHNDLNRSNTISSSNKATTMMTITATLATTMIKIENKK